MKVQEGQSFVDMAMLACGEATAAFELALLNGVSFTDDQVADSEIMTPGIYRKDVAAYYSNNAIIPATGITTVAENALIEEGVEFWAIEYDFVVS
jgi:hypothetical protein